MTSVSSSFAFQALMHKSLLDLQRELARGQQELSSGRHEDLSIVAGSDVGRDASLGQSLSDITTINETNKRVASRLGATSVALSGIKAEAANLRGDLLRAANDGANLDTVKQKATTALNALIATLNSTIGGDYIFAGINTDRAPVNPLTSSSAAQSSINAAFIAEFGFPQSSTAAGSITRTAMEAFLNGAWTGVFDSASWQSDWSNASDAPLTARISLSKTIDVSVSANDPAFRTLVSAYATLSELPVDTLSPDAANAVVNSALSKIDEAMNGITKVQAVAGGMLAEVNAETATIALQQDYLGEQIRAIEAVDPTETAARINSLMTQLETAYTLTAKLQQLSLTKYL